MFKPCETNFNLDRHIIVFLQINAFFCSISRSLKKVPTKEIPTAAICYDPRTDDVCLAWNPDFFAGLTDWEIRGVLTHEFYHLVFCHLTARRKSPPRMWNVATDLAINSIIVGGHNKSMPNATSEDRILPRCALIPGQWPVHPDGRELSKEEKDAGPLGALIAQFPTDMASEWYFNKLQEAAQKERNDGKGEGEEGEVWIDSMDDHSPWDNVPDAKREYVEGKVKAMVEKAVQSADSQATGWGSIPAELREQIRRSVSNIVNWRSVLRQFIGSMIRGSRTTSIKRINRRYPYIHPGLKRGYVAKLLVARDESGSVIDSMLEEFTAELFSLTRKVEIDFMPFDCACDDKEIVRWTRGTMPKKVFERTRGGGTDFNAPTSVFNDPKNRGRWDGLLIVTDGQAPSPDNCRGRRGWVLAKGCTLAFPSSELQVFVDKDKTTTGAWR